MILTEERAKELYNKIRKAEWTIDIEEIIREVTPYEPSHTSVAITASAVEVGNQHQKDWSHMVPFFCGKVFCDLVEKYGDYYLHTLNQEEWDKITEMIRSW